ncbi:MAG: alpha-glycosidase [Bacilli bacterium]|nr:alpha-glycosidase [Bacilli bacterium]
MDKCSIIHKSESIYSFPLDKNHVELRLLTKKSDDISKIELVYNGKYKFHNGVHTKEIFKQYSDELYDYYVEVIELTDLRFAYIFKITDTEGKIYYFSESGITDDYDITKGFYDFFQFPYINDIDLVKPNDVIKNRVFYQIFVDRFHKSQDNTNERINIAWGEKVDGKTIAGGNLKGIVEKIDYLKDLGINALYLTPIFESKTNHKYDTIDYYKIAKDFGDESDLKELINTAHQKDILVVLDGVFNHISIDNELFQDVIRNGNNSKYFKWFFIHGDHLDLTKNNYAKFGEVVSMPRLNLNNKEVQDYIINIGLHYLNEFKIDGFRLDVSDEIPHRFWIRFKEELQKVKPDFILIGENWHNAHAFLNSGYEFDSIMNYSITKEILHFLAWDKLNPTQFKNRIVSNLMRYKTNVNFNMFNLLSSHDVLRFLTECGSDVDKFLLGYAFIFMYPGVPCIYYGDEIAMEGKYDPDSRRCFIWDENKWNKKTISYMKSLIDIHKKYKINELNYTINVVEDIIILCRTNGATTVNLYINYSGKDKTFSASNVLLSNQYENNTLKNKGFIITGGRNNE